MKFEIKDGYVEIETTTLRAMCMSCGKYIGSAEAIKKTLTIGFQIYQYPLCKECFDKKIGKIASPDPNFDIQSVSTI